MTTLQLELPAPLDTFVRSQVDAGRFPSVGDYVRDLIAADCEQQALIERLSESAELEEHLQTGLNSDAGRHWDRSVLAEHKQRVMAREGRMP